MSSSNRIDLDEETDDDILFVVSKRRPLIPAGKVISTDNIITFPFPTEQRLVSTDRGFVMAIWLPTREAIGTLAESKTFNRLDNIADKIGAVLTVTLLIALHNVKKAARVIIFQEVRRLRVKRLTRRIARINVTGSKQIAKVGKLGLRRLVVSQRIIRKAPKVARFKLKGLRSIRILGTFKALRFIAVPFIIASVVLDVVLLAERTIKGGERAGAAGAAGGFFGGQVDIFTFGLAPGLSDFAEVKSTQALQSVGRTFRRLV